MNLWTKDDIEKIMIQLNNQGFPFKEYTFSALGEGMVLLGSGVSSRVYEAAKEGNKGRKYAVKVIGFGNKPVDSEVFCRLVETQKRLGEQQKNIVRIYDSVELLVRIEGEHKVVKVEKLEAGKKLPSEGNSLHLQFILMEKLSPVLVSYRRQQKLTPPGLACFDESEILKLGYEIGYAINQVHKKKLIHRDIKLENIFYDADTGHYKLGDFGIAGTTVGGMASTVAFTKGYGAPEVVGTLEDKYDYTADIYSFGMLLYVLLNELRFPESTAYHSTVYQYMQGFVPQEPLNGSDELVQIILKMISFNPENRYQSMEEVLNAFDALKYGAGMKYQREHKKVALITGSVFLLAGAAMWRLSFLPDMRLEFSIGFWLFCCLGLGKVVLSRFRKTMVLFSVGMVLAGVGLLSAGEFTWWKLLLLFLLATSTYAAGIFGAAGVAVGVTSRISEINRLSISSFSDYRWVTILFLTLAVMLFIYHYLIEVEREDTLINYALGHNLVRVGIMAFYGIALQIEYSIPLAPTFYEGIFGQEGLEWICSWNPKLVGFWGLVFCVFWMARERVLLFFEKKLAQ